MDIIDVIISKMMTPEGQADSAAATAQQAARTANNAVSNATAAAETASAAASAAEAAVSGIVTTINTEVDKLNLSLTSREITDGTSYDLVTTFPDNSTKTLQNVNKLYNTTGSNTDGAMTQKAISDSLSNLQTQINTLDTTSTNLGTANAGAMVVVGQNGYILPSTVTEEDLILALLKSGTYKAKDAIGLEIDYTNKSFSRIQESEHYEMGSDFDSYQMYKRRRCNVNDNGEIIAWENEQSFKTDGSNGQVMVYQPKFYYARLPLITEDINETTKIVRKEEIIISSTPQNGFKIHPLFINADGEEVDYVLLSAFEGSAYLTSSSRYDEYDTGSINFNTDKLSSIAGVKPISGLNRNFTVTNAEKMANNRGTGWHITNLAFESAMQMLEAIEFGTLNGQSALGLGIVNIPNNASYNCASLTGSTVSLVNQSGQAETTTNEINGTLNYYTEEGKCAISYRGIENPWGNIWRMIGGTLVYGTGSSTKGGTVYISPSFSYSTTINGSGYTPIGFNLPTHYDWISAFGYNPNIDWAFIPVECTNANSALPVGDNLWVTNNLNGTNVAMAGGAWSFGDSCGPFYYAFDKGVSESARAYSARLMFIPPKNSVYLANLEKAKEA